MKVPRLQYFCCCHDLKTGGIFLGWMAVLSSIAHFLLAYFIILVVGFQYMENVHDIGVLLAEFVILYVNIMLIRGSVLQNPKHIKPWLVWTPIQLIGSYIITIFSSNYFEAFDAYAYIKYKVLLALIFPLTGLSIYMWLVIWSLYKNLVEHQERLDNETIMMTTKDETVIDLPPYTAAEAV